MLLRKLWTVNTYQNKNKKTFQLIFRGGGSDPDIKSYNSLIELSTSFKERAKVPLGEIIALAIYGVATDSASILVNNNLLGLSLYSK